MSDGPTRVEDEDIVTSWREDAKGPSSAPTATVADPQDADGTDGDSADGTDGDGTDGTDGDSGGDADAPTRRGRRLRGDGTDNDRENTVRDRALRRRPARSSATTGQGPRCAAAGHEVRELLRWTCRPGLATTAPGSRFSGWSRTARRCRPRAIQSGRIGSMHMSSRQTGQDLGQFAPGTPSCSRGCSATGSPGRLQPLLDVLTTRCRSTTI